MKFGLEDNTRDALHFVLLGSGVLLALRLIVAGVELVLVTPVQDGLPAIIDGFRDGYLLTDHDILVTGGMELPGRVAVATLLAVSSGICLALLFALLARIFGRAVRRSALLGGRSGMLIVALWGLYAALLLPPKSVGVRTDGMIIGHRYAVLDAISLPWPATERMVPWGSINAIEHRNIASSIPGCGAHELVIVRTTSGEHIIASLTPHGPDCAAAQRDAAERSERLSRLLAEEQRAQLDH